MQMNPLQQVNEIQTVAHLPRIFLSDMLLLVSLANTGFASVPSCSKVTCPEPDLTIDGLRPGCSSRLAVNTSGAPMVGGTLCTPSRMEAPVDPCTAPHRMQYV